ncbi:MAG: aminotransferase class V-fold PLP-dependent enzyme [Pseudomonadota bacterium]
MKALPAPNDDFIGLDGVLNFATGGEPPLLQAHRKTFENFARDKAEGFDGYHRHWQVAERVRQKLAALVCAEPSDIGFLGSTSDGIARVVDSIDWRPGDNVLAPRLDYASGRYALGNLASQGVELRIVAERGWRLELDDLLAACDDRTRLIYISQVNALTGQHHDMEALDRSLAARGIMLLVDASHALGVVPVRADQCDFLVGAGYKFLLGVHQGVFVWNQRRQPDFYPSSVGWWSADTGADPSSFQLKDDARRAEYGNVSHLSTYLLETSLDYLAGFGVGAVAAHVRELGTSIRADLLARGLEIMTPPEPSERGGSISFAWPDTKGLMAAARAQDLLVWGDQGRIRISAHLFTSDADVAQLLERLAKLVSH